MEGSTTRDALPVQSMAHCDRAAALHTPQAKVHVLAHTALSRLVQLYGNGGRWMNRRRRYSACVRRARFSQGGVNRDTAIGRLEIASRPIHDAISLLDWRDIRRVLGATASMVQTLFRIKAKKLNLWNIDRGDRSCPHPTCDTFISASL